MLAFGAVMQTVRWSQPSMSSADLLLGVCAGVSLAVAAGFLLPHVTGRGPAVATLAAAGTMLLLIASGSASLPDGNLLEVSLGSRLGEAAFVAGLYAVAA